MTRTPWMAAAFAVVAAFAAGCALVGNDAADDDGPEDESAEQEIPLAQITTEAKTSLASAIATALAARPGRAFEAELEGEIDDGKREVSYEILILGADGKVYEADIDPGTGKLLEVEEEDDAEEVAEVRAAAKALPKNALTLTKLIAAAEKHLNGIALGAEIEAEDDGVECEIVLWVAGKLVEADVDLLTGKVLDTEEADDDEDEDDDEHGGHDHDDHDDGDDDRKHR